MEMETLLVFLSGILSKEVPKTFEIAVFGLAPEQFYVYLFFFFNSSNSEERDVLKNLSTTDHVSGGSEQKVKVTRQDLDILLRLNMLYL